MSSQWYFSVSGTVRGPVPSKDLVTLANSGQLQPTDLVWKEGMSEWVPARKIKKLFAKRAVPPPLPQVLPPPERPRGSIAAGSPPPTSHIPTVLPVVAYPVAPSLNDGSTVLTQSGVEFSLDYDIDDEPSTRRRSGSRVKSDRKSRSPLKLAIIAGVLLVFAGIVVSVIVALYGSLPGMRGTHVATEDVCLFQYALGDLDKNGRLSTHLFFQHFNGPLTGSKGTLNTEDSKVVVLKSKTKLEILKTQTQATTGDSISVYLVHFVRVRGGPLDGKEGWITDKYIRVNR